MEHEQTQGQAVGVAVPPAADGAPPDASKPHRSPWLRQYEFKKGNHASPGRPKGCRNKLSAPDILRRRSTRLAKRYVDRAEHSDTVLIDAMKRVLPVADAGLMPTTQVVVFVGAGELPRPFSDEVRALSDGMGG